MIRSYVHPVRPYRFQIAFAFGPEQDADVHRRPKQVSAPTHRLQSFGTGMSSRPFTACFCIHNPNERISPNAGDPKASRMSASRLSGNHQ